MLYSVLNVLTVFRLWFSQRLGTGVRYSSPSLWRQRITCHLHCCQDLTQTRFVSSFISVPHGLYTLSHWLFLESEPQEINI